MHRRILNSANYANGTFSQRRAMCVADHLCQGLHCWECEVESLKMLHCQWRQVCPYGGSASLIPGLSVLLRLDLHWPGQQRPPQPAKGDEVRAGRISRLESRPADLWTRKFCLTYHRGIGRPPASAREVLETAVHQVCAQFHESLCSVRADKARLRCISASRPSLRVL